MPNGRQNTARSLPVIPYGDMVTGNESDNLGKAAKTNRELIDEIVRDVYRISAEFSENTPGKSYADDSSKLPKTPIDAHKIRTKPQIDLARGITTREKEILQCAEQAQRKEYIPDLGQDEIDYFVNVLKQVQNLPKDEVDKELSKMEDSMKSKMAVFLASEIRKKYKIAQ